MAGDVLGGLADEHRLLVLSRTTRRSFAKGDVLFFEGEVGDTLHLLQTGTVAVQTSTPSGDVVTLSVMGPGASFGEQALIRSDTRRIATIVALEACETLALHRHEFDDLRARHPAVDRFLVDLLAATVSRLSQQLVEALHVSVEERTVRRLIELVDLYGSSRPPAPGVPVEIPVRQEDLANMVGTTRPTVNKLLRQMVTDGVVTLGRGRIVVLDPGRLRSMCCVG